jgi:hypothetical protein
VREDILLKERDEARYYKASLYKDVPSRREAKI